MRAQVEARGEAERRAEGAQGMLGELKKEQVRKGGVDRDGRAARRGCRQRECRQGRASEWGLTSFSIKRPDLYLILRVFPSAIWARFHVHMYIRNVSCTFILHSEPECTDPHCGDAEYDRNTDVRKQFFVNTDQYKYSQQTETLQTEGLWSLGLTCRLISNSDCSRPMSGI